MVGAAIRYIVCIILMASTVKTFCTGAIDHDSSSRTYTMATNVIIISSGYILISYSSNRLSRLFSDNHHDELTIKGHQE